VSKVLAKFRLIECTATRWKTAERDPQTGEYTTGEPEIATHLKFAAVQGDPFGKWTPSGSIDMIVKSEGAAKIFREAWDAYINSTEPEAEAPEFFVMLQRDHGNGWED
jgi:hypothetical protein